MLVLSPPGPAGRDKIVLGTPLLLCTPEEALLLGLSRFLSTIPPWHLILEPPESGLPSRIARRNCSVAVDFVRGLKCRLCGKLYPREPLNFCTEDFGPLEVDYDYEAIREALDRTKIELRPNTMWRFR